MNRFVIKLKNKTGFNYYLKRVSDVPMHYFFITEGLINNASVFFNENTAIRFMNLFQTRTSGEFSAEVIHFKPNKKR